MKFAFIVIGVIVSTSAFAQRPDPRNDVQARLSSLEQRVAQLERRGGPGRQDSFCMCRQVPGYSAVELIKVLNGREYVLGKFYPREDCERAARTELACR